MFPWPLDKRRRRRKRAAAVRRHDDLTLKNPSYCEIVNPPKTVFSCVFSPGTKVKGDRILSRNFNSYVDIYFDLWYKQYK